MGDLRFEDPYEFVATAQNRPAAVRTLRHTEVIQALAAAANHGDPYVANVLATEAMNRYRKQAAITTGALSGALIVIVLRTILGFFFAAFPPNAPDMVQFVASSLALALGTAVAFLTYFLLRERLARERA